MENLEKILSLEDFDEKFIRQVDGGFPDSLIITGGGDEIKSYIREKYKKILEAIDDIVTREMDITSGNSTNAEFIACDDLAIRILKHLRSSTNKFRGTLA